MNRSANGAEYESQGQVRSEAEHVTPGQFFFGLRNQGRRASRLPLAVISRAVGALFRLFVQSRVEMELVVDASDCRDCVSSG